MNREELWKHFEKIENKAKCSTCSAVFSLRSTVAMIRHLRICHGLGRCIENSTAKNLLSRDVLLENVLDLSLSKNTDKEDLCNPFFKKLLKIVSPKINFEDFLEIVRKKDDIVKNWINEWKNLLQVTHFSFFLMEEEQKTLQKKLTIFITNENFDIKRVTVYIGKTPKDFIGLLNLKYNLFSKTIFAVCSHRHVNNFFNCIPNSEFPKIASPDNLFIEIGNQIVDNDQFKLTFRTLNTEEQKIINQILEKIEISIQLVRVRCFLSDIVPTIKDLQVFINGYNGCLGEHILNILTNSINEHYFHSKATKCILTEATLLDPRYKLRYFEGPDGEMACNNIVERLFTISNTNLLGRPEGGQIQTAVTDFFKEPLLERSQDPLGWWEAKKDTHKLLYPLAKMFFCLRLDEKCKIKTDLLTNVWEMEKGLDIDKKIYLYNRLDSD